MKSELKWRKTGRKLQRRSACAAEQEVAATLGLAPMPGVVCAAYLNVKRISMCGRLDPHAAMGIFGRRF
ncbi:MAG: hypothetical protein WBN75_11940 [Verrucomicrobiia bacterium]